MRIFCLWFIMNKHDAWVIRDTVARVHTSKHITCNIYENINTMYNIWQVSRDRDSVSCCACSSQQTQHCTWTFSHWYTQRIYKRVCISKSKHVVHMSTQHYSMYVVKKSRSFCQARKFCWQDTCKVGCAHGIRWTKTALFAKCYLEHVHYLVYEHAKYMVFDCTHKAII